MAVPSNHCFVSKRVIFVIHHVRASILSEVQVDNLNLNVFDVLLLPLSVSETSHPPPFRSVHVCLDIHSLTTGIETVSIRFGNGFGTEIEANHRDRTKPYI